MSAIASTGNQEARMKRSYEKPVLTKREQLATITADGRFVSPFFDGYLR